MVESRTARMRLVHWSSGTDSPQRVDFNETFLSIESLAAIDLQGTLNDRPTPNKTGMYYFATDSGTLYRSDGTTWAVVGASVLSQLVKPARTDAIAQTVQGLASQTADLQRVLNSANVIYQRVRSNGDLIHGPLRVSQAARTANSTETVPADSAVTLDNGSTSMWGLSAFVTTGNTAGFFRAVRGGTTVFSVNSAGVVTTPSVVLNEEPTNANHATTKNYVDTKIGSTVYPLDGSQLSGVLPVGRGGTGGTTAATARSGIGAAASATSIATGAGLAGGGNLTASRTLSVTFAGGGVANTVARSDHGHSLTDANLTGTLPVNQGGTGTTTAAGALTTLGAAASARQIATGAGLSGGGDLTANRTLSVAFAGNGTADTAARSDHTHDINSSIIGGTLSVGGGGTGRSALNAGQYVIGDGTNGVTSKTPAQVRADIDAATSGHGHALTDANITGILPVAQGGTGATSTAAARTALAVPVNTTQVIAGTGLTGGGTLAASRTLNVAFAGTGTASTVARSNHTHNLADSTILGSLPWAQFPDIISLGSAVDLNDYTTTAIYHQSANAGAAAGTNYPVAAAGLLDVKAYSSMVYQTYYSYLTSAPRTFRRTKYSAAWGAWVEIMDNTDLANLVNVYAAKVHGHSLTDSNLTGTLPINQGGTGATTQAAARTALAVPSTSVSVNAGAGLTGGGTLAASRTLQVVFEGSGVKNTSARSDHGHSLNDSEITGNLPVSKGGIGRGSVTDGYYLRGGPNNSVTQVGASNVRSEIEAAYAGRKIIAGTGLSGGGALTADQTLNIAFPTSGSTRNGATVGISNAAARFDHQHSLADADIVGNLPVANGGTGRSTLAAGSYLRGNGTTEVTMRSPSEVLTDIGALAANRQAFAHGTGIGASGWSVYSAGQIVTPLASGGAGVTLEFMMSRTGSTFTQGTDFMTHGYVSTTYAPTHTSGTYFPVMIGTLPGFGYIDWSDGKFMTRLASGSISMGAGTRITANLSWGRI